MKYSDTLKKRVFKYAQYYVPSYDPGGVGWCILQLVPKAEFNTAGVILNGSQLTLPPGDYIIAFYGGGIRSGWSFLTLYNLTAGAEFFECRTTSSYHNPDGGTFEDLLGSSGYHMSLEEETVIDHRGYYGTNPTGTSHGTKPGIYGGTVTILRYAE